MKVHELQLVFFHTSALLYLLAAIWSVAYFIVPLRFRLRGCQGFLLFAFVLETVALVTRGYEQQRPPIHSGNELALVVAWALAGCTLAVSLFYRVRLIIPFAMPVVAILFIVAVANFSTHLHPAESPPEAHMDVIYKVWTGIHVVALTVSLGCFVLSFATALMYLFQERRLKTATGLEGWAHRLPALETLDRLGYGSTGIGHLLLTLGILLPLVVGGASNGSGLEDSLALWAGMLWLIYTAVLITRMTNRVGGRKIAVLTVLAASAGTLAYPVISFMSNAGLSLHTF